VVYGSALGDAQLNASVSVAGSFAYPPAAGTVLGAGAGQLLSVTFTPTDTANYSSATAMTTINVTAAAPVLSWTNPADIGYGTARAEERREGKEWVAGVVPDSSEAGTVLG